MLCWSHSWDLPWGSALDEDLVVSEGQFVEGRININIIIYCQTKVLSFSIFNFKDDH